MVTKKGKKLRAVISAAVLMVEPVAQQTVYAQEVPAEVQQETDISESTANEEATPQLQDGTAVIPQGADETTVKEILGQALVANADQVDLQRPES